VTSSGRTRPRAIDFHAHVIVPEVYAAAAEHNIFFELPTDPGVTDEMRRSIKGWAVTVLARMSDVAERIDKMDAMDVDIQVLSASLVHQGLEWADAQTSLRLARATNDWIAKAVASHPTRLLGLGTLPLHVPALAVTELERCVRQVEFVTDTNALSATQKEQIVRTNAAALLGVANPQLTGSA
jgi:predicted TIM-barrel fold metal-dependent hydrolase